MIVEVDQQNHKSIGITLHTYDVILNEMRQYLVPAAGHRQYIDHA
jgi:hypothetical protein